MRPNQEVSTLRSFPIVGIGGSAGGLAAFTELLECMKANTGMAFVVVQHLDPTHPSLLSDALTRATKMTVTAATNGARVQPDHVYVIPPNTDIALEGSALVLVAREKSRRPHLAIDFFFRSLAAQRGAQAIGVLLSGNGSDGTEGLAAIKAEGGLTFAQAPATAKFAEMPQNALTAGVVDTGLPIAALAHELSRLGKHPYLANALAIPAPSEKDASAFERILALVRQRTSVDFSEYKRGTLERRVARRMALREKEGAADYLRLLKSDEHEASALCEDLLIHVTSFFREPASFLALTGAPLATILERKPRGAQLRAWVAGCSTGEEVYSLAITLLESAAHNEYPRSIQIFGTDVSEKAIEKARAGVYSDTALREVSDELRRKYFVKLDQGYRIGKQARELCVFVKHDLARDPPFARLDVVFCRNVLIYFGNELQKRLMATFHYCLNRPGYLVLGRSESISGYSQFFTSFDRENKIFARTSARSVLQFAPGEKAQASVPLLARPAPEQQRTPVDLLKHVDRLLLDAYSPPGVVLNEKFEVLQFRGRTGPYLEAPAGQPQNNVLKMARDGLLVPLKSALAQAAKQRTRVRKHGVTIVPRGSGAPAQCELVVIPLAPPPGSTELNFAVLFEELPAPKREPRAETLPAAAEARPEVKRLRRELKTSKEYLQSLLEEHGRVNEDLGTANEELISGNEELQSMNEELQTAKEELQSANEELTTVNDELHSGNAQLNLVNGDLVNLLNTVEVPLVFLDVQRRIRRFTPQAQSIFNVLPSDIGRPIDDIKPKVTATDLDGQIARAIQEVRAHESEVQDQQGHWFRMRIRPYQTLDGKVDGAIVSLLDIDALKRDIDRAEWVRDYAVSVVDAVLLPLVVLDEKLIVISANESFYEVFGGTREDTEDRSLFALGSREWDIPALRKELNGVFETQTRLQGLEVEGAFPRVGITTMSFSARAVRFRNSRPMVLLAIEDVSARKQADAERKRLFAEAVQAQQTAEQANRVKDEFLATLSHELRTPLSTMMMSAQLLLRADLTPAKIHRTGEVIERSAKAQSQLIEDLLDVSRIVTGKLVLDAHALNLADVVPTALEAVALLAERKQIQLVAQLDGQVGQVSGDSLRLHQVLSNLLTNAVKFTPTGGTVTVSLADEGSEAVLRIADTGAGITPEFLPFVFDRFAQQETSKVRRFGGLGLGLSIVRHIVELHDGTVQAESPGPGKGATFTVRLPLLRGQRHEQGGGRKALVFHGAPTEEELARLRGLRILVVDDDLEALEAVSEMLRMSGAEISAARSAAEALAIAQESDLEVIVSDIAMPGTDGYGMIRSIRLLPDPGRAGVPAVALTAGAEPEGRQRAIAAGFQDYLEKPVDIARLVRVLVELAPTRRLA